MRWLVAQDIDTTASVDADTAAEAARIFAQALHGTLAQAAPYRRESRRSGGAFSILTRRWDGDRLSLAGTIQVIPAEPVRRERDKCGALPARDFPISRLPAARPASR